VIVFIAFLTHEDVGLYDSIVPRKPSSKGHLSAEAELELGAANIQAAVRHKLWVGADRADGDKFLYTCQARCLHEMFRSLSSFFTCRLSM
jgi:hypothetical protein